MADAAYWPLLKKCLPQKIPTVFVVVEQTDCEHDVP